MSLKSLVRALVRAAPVIAAHAPVVIAAVREIKRAAKRSTPAAPARPPER